MNETYQTLLTRRTIRAFQPKKIPDETMKNLILAAKYAPTAMGLQDRHFTIVNSTEVMDHIVSAAVENGASFLPGHTPFYHAPSVVVVSAPENSKYGRENAAWAAGRGNLQRTEAPRQLYTVRLCQSRLSGRRSG